MFPLEPKRARIRRINPGANEVHEIEEPSSEDLPARPFLLPFYCTLMYSALDQLMPDPSHPFTTK
jgi:hypothetical protein